MKTQLQPETRATGFATFARTVVGIDSSRESLEAARQAARLAAGALALVAAYDLPSALVGGTGPAVPAYLDERPLQKVAEHSLEAAAGGIAGVEVTTAVYRGRPWDALIDAAQDEDATLIAVGSHGTGRAVGMLVGSTATEIVHKAPCSVLVARPSSLTFPSRVVVGLDGSEESVAAYQAAQELARRFGARLDPVVASLEDGVGPEQVRQIIGRRVRGVFNYPVDALVGASEGADLVVVGSRGLRGLKSVGSVSERVAHQATCSVLVVRRPS